MNTEPHMWKSLKVVRRRKDPMCIYVLSIGMALKPYISVFCVCVCALCLFVLSSVTQVTSVPWGREWPSTTQSPSCPHCPSARTPCTWSVPRRLTRSHTHTHTYIDPRKKGTHIQKLPLTHIERYPLIPNHLNSHSQRSALCGYI